VSSSICRSAGILCVDGLVAHHILGLGIPAKIRRQRYLANRFQYRQYGSGKIQDEEFLVPARDANLLTAGKQQSTALLRRLAGTHLRQRTTVTFDALDQDLRAAAGILDRGETCRNHARVVEHQQVARVEQCRQIDEPAIDDPRTDLE
jgi:hypothetical protein